MMPRHLDIDDALFVATDLSVLSEWATPATLEDFDNEGRIYRPLDPRAPPLPTGLPAGNSENPLHIALP